MAGAPWRVQMSKSKSEIWEVEWKEQHTAPLHRASGKQHFSSEFIHPEKAPPQVAYFHFRTLEHLADCLLVFQLQSFSSDSFRIPNIVCF